MDVGSRTVKVVLIRDGKISQVRKEENTFDTLRTCRELLEGITYDRIVATGYGRRLISTHLGCESLNEIKAFSLGGAFLFPSCRTILDIGGQDTKAISLSSEGRLNKFEMNDKCAAGTGRFLEIMALALGFSLSEFGEAARSASRAERINSMCTVFAESEVISAIARGKARDEVALGIHQAVIGRAVAMLERITIRRDLVFAGGVALNCCIRTLLESAVGFPVLTPEDPQIVGALGCALYASSRSWGTEDNDLISGGYNVQRHFQDTGTPE
jgi:predicted CoA-substrate-specific enzyme activase